MFPFTIALLCLAAALALLIVLSAIDLRTRLLPDRYVTPFALTGLLFHDATQMTYLSLIGIATGGLTGFATLYLIRLIANRLYKTDALGLGDVKLMGAAGLWLGPDGVMLALALGAFAGLLHGLGYGLYQTHKTKEQINFAHLQIPAGPGFAAGIILAALYQFRDFSLF